MPVPHFAQIHPIMSRYLTEDVKPWTSWQHYKIMRSPKSFKSTLLWQLMCEPDFLVITRTATKLFQSAPKCWTRPSINITIPRAMPLAWLKIYCGLPLNSCKDATFYTFSGVLFQVLISIWIYSFKYQNTANDPFSSFSLELLQEQGDLH